MPRLKLSLLLAALLLAVSSMRSSASAVAIINGGFETGDFTGWTLTGNYNPLYTTVDGSLVNSGNYAAHFGPVGAVETLSQTLADTPGQAYTLSFYLASDFGQQNSFTVSINGGGGFTLAPVPSQGFTLYTTNFTGTGSDLIAFNLQDDPAFLHLDDVSVADAGVGTPVSPGVTPEPSGIFLLGTGLITVGGLARRRRSRS